jgi:hypothetical protein
MLQLVGISVLETERAYVSETSNPKFEAVFARAFDVYAERILIAKAVSYAYAVPDAIDWDSDGDWDAGFGFCCFRENIYGERGERITQTGKRGIVGRS